MKEKKRMAWKYKAEKNRIKKTEGRMKERTRKYLKGGEIKAVSNTQKKRKMEERKAKKNNKNKKKRDKRITRPSK